MDQSGLFRTAYNPTALHGKSKGKNQTITLEAATDVNRGSQWLVLCRPQGVMEVNFAQSWAPLAGD